MSDGFSIHVDAAGRSHLITTSPDDGQTVLSDLLRRHDLPLNTRCGERGLCDGCLVELRAGELRSVADGEIVTATSPSPPRMVRGCEYYLAEGVAVSLRIPPRSLLSHRPSVLTEFQLRVSGAHAPLFDASDGGVAVAIDLGTTTVVAALIDLATGDILRQASSFNRQIDFGEDVLTRINLCLTDAMMLERLQEAVVNQTVNPLLEELLGKEYGAGRLRGMVISGNTTMLHLLAGVDPSPMGVAPFTPSFVDHLRRNASGLGLAVADIATEDVDLDTDSAMSAHLLPGASAYIGADIVAGVLASGLAYDEGPSMLIDVGTNGEIVLKHKGQLIACATAAGPAFEGSGLKCGVRATEGAISHVRLSPDDGRIDLDVIGEAPVHGLCGSAYIDVLSEGRRVGLLTRTGRFDREGVRAWRLVSDGAYGSALVVAVASGAGGREIVITEADIARLLQAKAAIAAGILTLLSRVGLSPADLRVVYLAGGFGMHVDVKCAMGCGLLPGIDPGRIELVGNTSLAGAYLATIDRGSHSELTRIGEAIEIVELNQDPGFEDRYIDQLSLP